MPQVRVHKVALKGPAGSVSTDKRVKVFQVGLHGPQDKRVRVYAARLQAPPADARVKVYRARLVGPNSPMRPVYIGTAAGWVPVDIYLPVNGSWQKIT